MFFKILFKLAQIKITQSPTKELIFIIKCEQMKHMLNSGDLKGVFCFIFMSNKWSFTLYSK